MQQFEAHNYWISVSDGPGNHDVHISSSDALSDETLNDLADVLCSLVSGGEVVDLRASDYRFVTIT